MTVWQKPLKGTPSAGWYVIGPEGWLIRKALVREATIYQLSHRRELICTGTFAECEAEYNRQNKRAA